MSRTIGIDARAAAEVTAGKGRFVRELLLELARREDDNRYLLYTRSPWESLGPQFEWRTVSGVDPLWHVRAGRAAAAECDAFLVTSSYVLAWFVRVPFGLVVHDLVAFHPAARPNRRAALIERASITRAVARASWVMCDSKATRADLVQRFPSAEAKASVVYLGVDSRFGAPLPPQQLEEIRRRYELARPFVLSVGTLEPRKNLVRLIGAFAALPGPLRTNHDLVLAGPKGWAFEEIIASARATPGVRVLGPVEDDELAALYQLCRVFCYPALYEGFGLPLLEAMSAGAASITSNISSLPEVGGEGALYVDPLDVEGLRDTLQLLLESDSEREALGRRARERAAQFTWERTGAEIVRRLEGLTPAAL